MDSALFNLLLYCAHILVSIHVGWICAVGFSDGDYIVGRCI